MIITSDLIKTFWAREHERACRMVTVPAGAHIVVLYCAPSGVVVDAGGSYIGTADMSAMIGGGKWLAVIECMTGSTGEGKKGKSLI